MRAGLENLQAESEHRSVCRFLLSDASPLIVFQGFDCFIGHREKGDQVEDRHQTDTDVPEIPDEGVGGESSDKQHDKCQQFIGSLCAPAVTEQIGHIGPGIKQDADEGGKTEHPQDQGDEDDTDLTKIAVHSRLKQIHSPQTVDELLRGKQHDHCGAGTKQCIDEDAECLRQTDTGRMRRLGGRCSAWCRATAGFIGKETALDTVHEDSAKAACGYLTKTKSL